EEPHQASDREAFLAAVGGTPSDCSPEVLKSLPQALREHGGEATVASFGSRILSVEPGDTHLLAYGLAVDVGTTSVVTSLMELASGAQLASVSSLNPP